MKFDKIKIYLFELILIVILLFTLFAPNIISRLILSLILIIYTVALYFFVKKRSKVSANARQITLLMTVFALFYLGVFYLTGLYFGFEKTKIYLSVWSFTTYIIPITVIIVTSEIIRKILISQDITLKIKKYNLELSKSLTYISMVLVDLVIYTGAYNLTDFTNFITIIGFVLFASLSCNLLYNYISKRYGSNGIIAYRLITILYMYIIPVIPKTFIFLRSFLRMVYPYIIYLVIENTYSKRVKGITRKEKKQTILSNSILFVVIVSGIMLVSCQFKFGILVIGTGSMSGTIDVGDAIIYEKYDYGNIDEGQVIIFNYNNIQTVHRVVKIEKINGEYRYYTKGDANSSDDELYRTKNDIYGLVKLRIKYIGKPTLWLRNIFK